MWYRIDVTQFSLKAEIFNRQTKAETREFLRAVVARAAKQACSRVLICIRASKPVFRVGEDGLIEYMKILSEKLSCQIALLGDSEELCLAHEYLQLLAAQRGISMRSFCDETVAMSWLNSGSAA